MCDRPEYSPTITAQAGKGNEMKCIKCGLELCCLTCGEPQDPTPAPALAFSNKIPVPTCPQCGLMFVPERAAHALAYCTQERRDGCECYVDGVCTHACVVAAAPSDGLRTAELKKHRHKLPDDGYEARYTEYFTCSHCKKMAYGGDELNFCPNCGRKFVKAALAQTEKEEKK